MLIIINLDDRSIEPCTLAEFARANADCPALVSDVAALHPGHMLEHGGGAMPHTYVVRVTGDLYRDAMLADEAWSRELRREYGADAGDARYDGRGVATPDLRVWSAVKVHADRALIDHMQRAAKVVREWTY